MTRVIVVFGAAVRPDGSASPSLLRRARLAARAAIAHPTAPLFCSGGAVAAGPSEASVIAGHLAEAGVAQSRLVLDEDSRDTLQNVTAAARFIRREGLAGALACTDVYHRPRVLMLFRLLGVTAEPALSPGCDEPIPSAHHLRMRLREAAAFPCDMAIALLATTGAPGPYWGVCAGLN